MKTKLFTILSFLLFGSCSAFAQDLSFGVESGVNFSNVNKSFDMNDFRANPGPISGLFVKKNIGKWFVGQLGVNHATYYFGEMKIGRDYSEYWMYSSSSYYQPPPSYSSIIGPSTYYYSDNTKFSFLRVPLIFKFKTPGKVNVEVGGGAYYAFLTNDEYRGKDKDLKSKEYREENFPSMNDWGWILSSTVNYNINHKWHVFANAQITSGEEEYFENVEGKIGSTEITFGIGYRPFAPKNQLQSNDSLGKRIRIVPHAGVLISHAKNSREDGSKYKPSFGFSSGISLNFEVGEFTSLKSGVWYERKGYQLNYDGNNPLIYRKVSPFSESYSSEIESNVKLDYITIPAQFEVQWGKRLNSNLNIGGYFSLLQNAFSVGEKIETSRYDQGFSTNRSFFYKSFDESIKKLDGGFIFGYRLDIPVFKFGEIFFAVNQSFGVMNILKEKEGTQSNSYLNSYDKIRNNASSILFGLNIPVIQN